jgi:hypothetical protein
MPQRMPECCPDSLHQTRIQNMKLFEFASLPASEMELSVCTLPFGSCTSFSSVFKTANRSLSRNKKCHGIIQPETVYQIPWHFSLWEISYNDKVKKSYCPHV